MRKIIARDIKVFAYHGVLPREKREGQEFLIDIEIDLDPDTAVDDDLSSTVDYAEVVEGVASLATGERCNLMETLASRILGYLLSLDGVKRAQVTVKKPEAPLSVPTGWVGVSLTGERAEGRGQSGGDGGAR